MSDLLQDVSLLFGWEMLLLVVIVLVAQTSETITGFGSTVISVALGAILFPLDVLVPVIVPLNFILSLYIVLIHRQHLDGKTLGFRIIPFIAVGMPLGLLIFNLGHQELLKTGFGIFVIFISVFELIYYYFRRGENNIKPLNAYQSAPWLIAGGIVHGIYASGGPLVVYYASKQFTNKRVFRSTLSGLWLILTVVLMLNFVATGKLTAETLTMSAALLPTLFLGIGVGEFLHERIDEKMFRLFVYILLLVAGVSLII